MPFTEFCCRAGGSNLNAGSRDGSAEPAAAADFTYASGSWVASTGVFTVASGDPAADGVAVGDFVSVYDDSATVTGFVGRVTAVSSTTITVSLTAKAGTAPVDGTSNRTVKVGGAWQGPNGAVGFPFNFIAPTLTNATGNYPRINFKNDQTYGITAGLTQTIAGPIAFQGYTSSYGDKGRATIDGGSVGASFVLITSAVANLVYADLILNRNGATGAQGGTSITSNEVILLRCVVSNTRGSGISGALDAYECESFGNVARGISTSSGVLIRCVSHHNGIEGFNSVAPMINCISYKNSGSGFVTATTVGNYWYGCDAYDNAVHGFYSSNAGAQSLGMENCNSIGNTGSGMFIAATGQRSGFVRNCGFGDNAGGDIGTLPAGTALLFEDNITYPTGTTPWVDPENGDFTPKPSPGSGAGAAGYGQNLVGYLNIGALQSEPGEEWAPPVRIEPTYALGI